jgi:hypothetical protein
METSVKDKKRLHEMGWIEKAIERSSFSVRGVYTDKRR